MRVGTHSENLKLSRLSAQRKPFLLALINPFRVTRYADAITKRMNDVPWLEAN